MDNSNSIDLTQLSSAERRKVLKPQVERKRRDRINKSIDDLKEILIQNDPRLRSRASKLEKADILELVVEQMNVNGYAGQHGQSTSSSNGLYTEGYLDCLNAALTYLWQTGVISNPQMCNLIRDTLLQRLLQKTDQNPMTRSTHCSVTTPAIVHVTSEPVARCRGTSLSSEVTQIAFGKTSSSQMPHASGLSIFDVSQIPTIPFDKRSNMPDIYGRDTAGLSKVPFDNGVPMPFADSQFSTSASLSLSQSLPKSRFVPYTTINRPALRNKNANSSGLVEPLPTRTETVESDTAHVWSLNDDICYSMTSSPWMFSDESNQHAAKETSSKSHEGEKLQKKTRSESIAMSRSNANLTQRPLSAAKVSDSSKSKLCINETRRPLTTESSTAVKEGGSHATTSDSDREPPSGTKRHPTKDDGFTGATSNQDDVWRPF